MSTHGAKIRAKMFVNTVSKVERSWDNSPETQTIEEIVKLHAVYSGKEGSANNEWSKATPSGTLDLTISNPTAQGRLKPGQFYYVDLIECDKESP